VDYFPFGYYFLVTLDKKIYYWVNISFTKYISRDIHLNKK
jgi:hypothetical protein